MWETGESGDITVCRNKTLLVPTQNTINVLGVTFESNMKWKEQVSKAMSEANKNLYGIKMIKML